MQPCSLPAVDALTNAELREALDKAESAWAECAAVVDQVVECQEAAAPAPIVKARHD